MINILFIGDIVGSSGRSIVKDKITLLKQQYEIDYIIANGENAAHGKGLTKKIYDQLMAMGIDMLTMGNHTFSKKEIFDFIEDANIVRPVNMEPLHIGKATRVVDIKGKKVAISNLSGEVFMHDVVDSPFAAMEDILDDVTADIHVVDLHAEATSEKIAFAYYFAQDVKAVVGTHTHVQTADERIIESGCAVISDLGMCGAYTSVLGRDVDEILTRFTSDEKTKYTLAQGPAIFCGALISFDEKTCRAVDITRIQIRP